MTDPATTVSTAGPEAFAVVVLDTKPAYHTVATFTDRELWTWLHQVEDFSRSTRLTVPIPGIVFDADDDNAHASVTVGSCVNDKAHVLTNLEDPRITNHNTNEGFFAALAAATAGISAERIYQGVWY